MDIVLNQGEVICIDGDNRGLTFCCQQGQLWITQPNDSRDHILAPQQRFVATSKGRIAVTALQDAQLQFVAPVGQTRLTSTWQAQTI